jgi:hypothetical protein
MLANAGDWLGKKYDDTKEWVKKHADDIDLITDFIPVVGQAKDAYYTIKFGWRCYKDPSDENLLELGFALIGWVPYAGDGVKSAFKVIRTNPDRLLAAARFAISRSKKKYGTPEQYLYDLISVQSLTTGLDEAYFSVRNALQSKRGTEYVLRKLKEIVDSIKSLLNRVSNALRKYLDKHLPKNPTSSAVPTRKVTPATSTKSTTTKAKVEPKKAATAVRSESAAKTGTKGESNSQKGNTSTNAILDTLINKNIGAVGEHMADYWIADQLGTAANHDSGEIDSGGRNKSGGLNKLRIGANNPGIDSIWQTDKKTLGSMRTNTYAIVEAKSSLGTGTGGGPGSLLADNGAKAARRQRKTAAAAPKGKVAKNGDSNGSDVPREKKMEEQQMSHDWVRGDLEKRRCGDMKNQYSRHLLYFNAIQGKEHYAALAKNLTAPDASLHKNPHTPTRYWDDDAIEKALQSRVNKSTRKKKP